LGWVNRQPHPAIQYYAAIRQYGFNAGDEMVTAFSQGMNQIPALRGQAKIWMTHTGHSLNPQDGALRQQYWNSWVRAPQNSF